MSRLNNSRPCVGRRVSCLRFVQNRCYAVDAWDQEIRKFCKTQGMHYQGFSLLTANRDLMAHAEIARLARHHQCTVSQLIFCFALEVGMIALTGTTDPSHMKEDLQAFDLHLDPEEVALIETLAHVRQA